MYLATIVEETRRLLVLAEPRGPPSVGALPYAASEQAAGGSVCHRAAALVRLGHHPTGGAVHPATAAGAHQGLHRLRWDTRGLQRRGHRLPEFIRDYIDSGGARGSPGEGHGLPELIRDYIDPGG